MLTSGQGVAEHRPHATDADLRVRHARFDVCLLLFPCQTNSSSARATGIATSRMGNGSARRATGLGAWGWAGFSVHHGWDGSVRNGAVAIDGRGVYVLSRRVGWVSLVRTVGRVCYSGVRGVHRLGVLSSMHFFPIALVRFVSFICSGRARLSLRWPADVRKGRRHDPDSGAWRKRGSTATTRARTIWENGWAKWPFRMT